MSKKYLVASGFVIAIALGIFYAGYSSVLNKDSSAIRAVKTDTKIEPFSARLLNGEEYNYKATDDVVVYEVFASWCIPCRKSVPEVLEFSKAHPEVIVTGVAYRDVDFEIDKFQKEYGSFETVIMSNGSVEDSLEIRSVPQTIFTQDGIIKYRVFGTTTAEDLSKILGLVEGELPSS